MSLKNLYIIGGCNGAGKTTASVTVLPQILNCREFVNADEIARGLSPFNPENVNFEAGRLLLSRIRQLLRENESFAFETTLATRSYKNFITEAKSRDYLVNLLFFWLDNVSLAKERVRSRVREGGHSIPDDVIERRYINGIKNLFDIYLPAADNATIYDNSRGDYELMVEQAGGKTVILNSEKYNKLIEIHNAI